MSKLIVQKVETFTDGSIKDHQYGIGDVGLVLEILRNKLYRDPILAVVREYITNARDAHVEAGKGNVPVVVHLPTREDYYFKVQDFGPGLSPERIENIFCNYASSTKRNSEDQVGYFGIGSKSAFAYSDSFTIISVVDGVTRTYQSYIDESRKGKISCLYEAVSDQPNGTTVIIPIKRYDCEKFQEKLVEVTEFWDVRPVVYQNNRVAKMPYRDETTIFSGTDWKLNRYEGYHTRSSCVIMGGIAYPIDMSHFDSHPARSFFQYSAIRIYFNNSDLSLAASRDSLHYDSRTIKKISDKFNSIIDEINDKIDSQIQTEDSYCDALLKFNFALTSSPELNKVLLTTSYQGKTLFKNPKIGLLGKNAKLTWYSKNYINGILDYKVKTVNYKSFNDSASFCDIISSSDNALVFNDIGSSDLKKYALSVFELDSSLKNVAVLTLSDDKESTAAHPMFWFCEEVSEYKTSGIVPVKTRKVSSRKSLTNKDNYFLYKFDPSTSRADRGRTTVEVSPNEDIVYFFYDIKACLPTEENSNIFSELGSLETILGKKIYGISSTKNMEIPENWIKLNVAMNKKFEEYLKISECSSKEEIYDIIASERQTITYRNYSQFGFSSILEEQFDKNNIIGEYYRFSQEVDRKRNKIQNFKRIESMLRYVDRYNFSYKEGENYAKLVKLNEEMHAKYPLLKHVIRSHECSAGSIECRHLNDYINMIDVK